MDLVENAVICERVRVCMCMCESKTEKEKQNCEETHDRR